MVLISDKQDQLSFVPQLLCLISVVRVLMTLGNHGYYFVCTDWQVAVISPSVRQQTSPSAKVVVRLRSGRTREYFRPIFEVNHTDSSQNGWGWNEMCEIPPVCLQFDLCGEYTIILTQPSSAYMYDGSEAFCLKAVWHNSWTVFLIPTEYSAPPWPRSIFHQQCLPHGDYANYTSFSVWPPTECMITMNCQVGWPTSWRRYKIIRQSLPWGGGHILQDHPTAGLLIAH